MVARDAPLSHILTAGNWRSAAFVEYLDKQAVDERAVLHLLMDDDDVEEDNLEPARLPPPRREPVSTVVTSGSPVAVAAVAARPPAKRSWEPPFAYKRIENFFPPP